MKKNQCYFAPDLSVCKTTFTGVVCQSAANGTIEQFETEIFDWEEN